MVGVERRQPTESPPAGFCPDEQRLLFASVSFGVLTYLVVRLVGQPTAEGRAPPRLVAGLANRGRRCPRTAGMVIGGLPTAIFGGDNPNVTAQAVVLTVEIIALWLIGATLLIQQWATTAVPVRRSRVRQKRRARSSGCSPSPTWRCWRFLVHRAANYLDADEGTTALGTPIGSLPYTIVCFLLASLSLAAALAAERSPDLPRRAPSPTTRA